MSNYEFTQDWFHWAPEVWGQLIPLLPERGEDGRYFIEIGSFEGRSAVWIGENMMQDGDFLTCIDTWSGGEEHANGELDGAEARFTNNVRLFNEKFPDRSVYVSKGMPTKHLGNIIYNGGMGDADFIYIDGSHIARDVLTDACMAWPLLKPKGILVFDDYLWGDQRDILHRPKIAIDAFCNIFAEEINVIHTGYQLIVQKKEQ